MEIKNKWLRVIKARGLQLSHSLHSSNIWRRSISYFRKLLEGSHTYAILWSDMNVQISKLFVGILCILKSSFKKKLLCRSDQHSCRENSDGSSNRKIMPPPRLKLDWFYYCQHVQFLVDLSDYYLFVSSAYSLKLNCGVLWGFYWDVTYATDVTNAQFRCLTTAAYI
jgi:hypothetical protein